MANIMSMVKLKNHTSRNAFDIGRKNAFTAKVGELLPVACIECLPGDNIKAKVQHFTRTMPVNTAAYTRLREYYDWFFVPTNLLWNKFNTFVTQMTNNVQHAQSIVTNNVLSDTHPYFQVLDIHTYLRQRTVSNPTNIFGFDRAELTAKLLNYLGYGNFSLSLGESSSENPYRENLNLNPFPLLAYQKIYQDYFRNTQWEQAYAPAFNLDYIKGTNDNFISTQNLTIGNYDRECMFDLRYCNWNKDKFMGLLPSPQYGTSASLLGSVSSEPLYLQLTTTNPNSLDVPVSVGLNANQSRNTNYRLIGLNGQDTGLTAGTVLNSALLTALREKLGISESTFSVLALRQAESLQKWQEITQSQQQDYKSQIEAHFGVSMSDAYSERCRYIDGSVSNLDISEVTNTNITDNNGADIAGKGVGVGQGNMKFSTDVHGYLMCIYHAVPLLDYAISGVSRVNMKTKATDYAIPEFDRTGMVSVPTVELTNNVDSTSFTPNLLGYAPRYYDYKTSVDEVHGAFMNDLSHWVAPVGDAYINTYLDSVKDISGINYIFFKVNPSFMNPIFSIDADSSMSSDQLLINANFDITAVRNLDRNGLPY